MQFNTNRQQYQMYKYKQKQTKMSTQNIAI